MTEKRKILYISGTRADYGLIRETLFLIKKSPNLKIEIAATGMHLMKEFGCTISEIEKDGFRVYPIRAVYERDNSEATVKFMGELILKLLKEMRLIRPDMIFVQGDRAEMLAGAILGTYLGIPVVHSHGGEVTFTVDEIARHAVSKLSHIHLVSTQKAGERLVKMGEDKWRIFRVGAPGLDSVLKKELFLAKETAKKYKLDLSKPLILVLQHPVTSEIKDAEKQMKETMEAIKELSFQTVVIYPSADAGGRRMIRVVEKYRKYPFIRIYKNIFHNDYLKLMKVAKVLVGNSSSGLIEAPSLGLATVNVGIRQKGRERAENVIDVSYKKEEIKRAILKTLYDKKFKKKIKKRKNPYGDGKAGKRIVGILSKIKIDRRLLQKQITY